MDGDFSWLGEEADMAMGQNRGQRGDQPRPDDVAMHAWMQHDLRRRYAQVIDERLPPEWLDLLPPD